MEPKEIQSLSNDKLIAFIQDLQEENELLKKKAKDRFIPIIENNEFGLNIPLIQVLLNNIPDLVYFKDLNGRLPFDQYGTCFLFRS